ncbi:membrane-bound PQQ-dependent dehydrogenase, glucose/quinate/shikimate family [Eleftheria terrae]|uniref:membrane-bound PQQ-dependent dehydrogenase, glucose/quinate/shikimate family n=1 Tax=Eleftheria terrae TaxID=1597781 RepID=UPI00263A5ACC|nr:membrane-bound PQQ-dependent dehydrogenase, glucose/quinate/shikimate family [Eleftheria terrae]WKB53181.1 membrane-bound PQQ-dependent dehydrogenase, glucose/quinate/shikimate family [Eleftheria terrae]
MASTTTFPTRLFLPGLVLIAAGLALGAGGVRLLTLGGSAYYLVAGLCTAVAGGLLLRRQRAALALYALFLAGTSAWAVAEVGLDWWPLVPRIDVWLVLGAYLSLPWVQRALQAPAAAGPGSWQARLLLGVTVVVTVLLGTALLRPEAEASIDTPAQGLSQAPVSAAAAAAPTPGSDPRVAPADWVAYGGTGHGQRYAPAGQITPDNVSRLQLAWTFHTGDLKGPGDPHEIANEVTPLKANGLLYICTPHNIVIALDPDSGQERWRFDPRINRDAAHYQHMICRGVAYHDSTAYPQQPAREPAAAAVAAACPRRIFAPTADATIIALNADTGRLCEGFGQGGVIGLTQGMGPVKRGFLNPTSPPAVSQRVLVVSASVTDNESTDEPSGVIRGYDIDTGRLLWNWDAGNPDETAPLPEGKTYVRNSPNSWSVTSIDERLGMAYVPMGNQTPDIWGGNRIPAGERFNSAIVALDLATGRLRWVYQTVHHDIWDMDIGAQPTLLELDTPAGKVPALLAPTKRGDIYVLDRRDGRLLVAAPERPVPQGAAKGDRTAPTQPFSELSFKPPRPLRETDMWGGSPFDQLMCRITFRGLRYEGMFTPPSEQGSLVYPGNYGIFDWGGVAVDPQRQVMIANPNYMAFVSKLYPRGTVDDPSGTGSEIGLQPMKGTPYAVDLHPLLSPWGIPCQAPPWGYLAAIDLKTMRKLWMHKNGTIRDSAPLPVPVPLGVPSLGGPMVTAGGVAFMSATLDDYLRAYDVRTGQQLWQARLPAGGQATPMSYVSDRTGRQYVVVMAGGHGSLGTRLGDSLVAYALPQP